MSYVKSSGEDLIVVEFLSLVIFDDSFGNIVAKVLILLVCEILMTLGFFLSPITEAKR